MPLRSTAGVSTDAALPVEDTAVRGDWYPLTHMLPLAAQLARKARSLSSGSQKLLNFFETIFAIGD